MNASHLSVIFGSIFLNVIAQFSLKYGMRAAGYFGLEFVNLYASTFKILKNPYVFSGLGCYVLSAALWIVVLSRVDVSYAYPMTGLGYVLASLIGFFLFQENLSFTRILGVVIILIGTIFVSRS